MRILITIISLIIAAYGSATLIADKAITPYSWAYYLYQICPWVLLPASIKAWHQCLVWRRMSSQKNVAPHLSRGHHQPSRSNTGTSILEHACLALLLLSIAAIFKQLEIQNTHWFMGGAWGSYFMLRLAIKAVK